MDYIVKSLTQGNYDEMEEKCRNIEYDEIRDMIMNMAYDTENICIYSFLQYMFNKTKKEFWLELMIDIMINPLCFLEGAYSVALFHARELLKLQRNIENLEMILFFYEIPEKLVDKEEAIHIAEEILKIEPDNKVALSII